MNKHTFTAGFLFAGLGAGALGFLEAAAYLEQNGAKFRSLGGIDIDPLSCKDFEYLTKSKATVADLSTMSPADLRAAWGDTAPDCIFLSPPCKGFSGLLSKRQSEEPKYQALNELVLKGLFLACETWDTPPSLLVLENVPRITKRGAQLLARLRSTLRNYGYLFHEATHDCGVVGGLAQHRRRYLMVARLPKKVPAYVYQPPKQRVRGCGEVLEALPIPLPGESTAGVLHQLPKLSWLNWVRLSLIPAGGDWRDLPKQGSTALGQTAVEADSFAGRPGLFGVLDSEKPAPTVTGAARVSSGNMPAAIADARVSLPCQDSNPNRHHNKYKTIGWQQSAPTVIGATRPGSGALNVADPRLSTPLAEGQDKREVFAKYPVRKWTEPTGAITGPGTNGEFGVADCRVRMPEGTFGHVNKVTEWKEPTGVVTHSPSPASGAIAVADPRVELNCTPRSGSYGVLSWEQAAGTITGAASVDNGSFAIADPRKAPDHVPVIISADNTWHRPLTTLELAKLQGLPHEVDGAPLALAGKSSAKWRERIGNAVPVGAAKAIAMSLLTALLAASLGTWTLGSTGLWVKKNAGKKTKKARKAQFSRQERVSL